MAANGDALVPYLWSGGMRFLLKGNPVEVGQELELATATDGWVRGTFAWSCRYGEPPTLETAGGPRVIPVGALLRQVES